MRAGYSVKRIKDICDKGSSNVAQKDLEGHDGEFPIYGASGFIKNVDFFHQDREYVGIVKDGSGIGRVAFYPPKSSLIGTLQYIFPKAEYDIRYVGYCLQSLDLASYRQGAAIPHIYFRDYGEREVLVADNIKEQQRIVGILDQEFAKIDALKANAEKSLQAAKDLFQATLKKELEPKEGWTQQELGTIADFKNGLNFGKEVGNFRFRFLGVGDFKDNLCVDVNTLGQIQKDKIDDDYLLHENDIVFVRSNGSKQLVGRCLLVKNAKEKATFSGFCIRCRLKGEALLPQYLIHFCTMDETKKYLTSSGEGCNISNLNQRVLSSLKVWAPKSREEQARIVAIIEQQRDNINDLQDNYQKTLALCDDLKQALLRKAFNGEL